MAESNTFTFYGDGLQWKEVNTKAGRTYVVKGHASTSDPDLVNDIVTENALKSMLDQARQRTIKLDFEHEAFRGSSEEEKAINITKSPLGKATNVMLDEKGLVMEWTLNPDWKARDNEGRVTKTFKEVWNEIKGGFLDAFSIAFIPVKTAMKKVGDKTMRMLDDLQLLNVALTGNPINPAAKMADVMAKSVAASNDITDSHSSNTDSKSDIDGGDQMAEDQQETFEVKDAMEAISELKSQVSDLAEQLAAEQKSEPSDTQADVSETSTGAAEQKSAEELKSQLEAEVKAREQAEADLKALREETEDIKSKLEEQEKILSQPAVKGFLEQREAEEVKSQDSEQSKTNSKAKGPLDLIP